MKKKNIIKEKKDFDAVFKLNNKLSSKYAYLYTKKQDDNYRFAVCVSKKLGKAVKRNKIKRQIKDIIDKSGLQFSYKDYIIIIKQSIINASFVDIQEDIIDLLKKSI